MDYKVLYRKYRPDNFSSIVGQDYMVSILKNAIKTEKISHAYIFSGPRGTGKTSTAKVFAKAINCLNPTNEGPCNECDSCKKILKWYNLIPIFSYVFQKGKCSYCHKKISSENIWAELATGFLFLFTYLWFNNGYNFFVGLIICSLLIIIFISDFKYMIILDSPLIISSILIIILKLIFIGFKDTITSILSGVALFIVMLVLLDIGKILFKKEALGGGDIKFSFLIGLILNFPIGLVTIILSSFLALPYAVASVIIKKNNELPYGPFLAGALFIVFFNYDKFLDLFNFLI